MHSSKRFPIRRVIAACMMIIGAFSFLPQNSGAQCGGYGQKPLVTSQGLEFLVCFMRNIDASATNGDYVDIYFASASEAPTTVTVTCKQFPKLHKELQLAPHASLVYHLSADDIVGAPGNDARMETCETIDFTIFRVVATNPIACYGMNNKGFSADAFLALPRNVASTDYRVMSYYNSSQLTGQEMPSEFCVAAFDTLTEVTIIPSATTCSGSPAGKEIKFTLNNGEGVQIMADKFTPNLDMTGSIVRSNKPVVVYGGHARTETPINYFYNDAQGQHTSRDHICEAIPPTSTWGASFIAKNFGRDSGDVMRVLALHDNTVVKVNGKVWCTLMHDKFRDTIIDQDNSVALNNIAVVETDTAHRILVGMIAHTAINGGNGDPFLAIVPPLNQTYTDFTYFITDNVANYLPDQQFLIVAVERSNVDNVTIDNNKLPKTLFTDVPPLANGSLYSVTTLNQPMGIHRITTSGASESGFTILAYGWGPLISYGYTAGALLKPLAGIIPVSSPQHSVAPGDPSPKPMPAGINVRNILTERVYFDKAEITYTQNTQKIPVRLKKDIALETGTIEMAEEKTLELVTAAPITETITGTVRIWYHSRLWFDLWPVDFPFIITPQMQADVKSSSDQTAMLGNYPNPVSGKTTVHFAIPSRAYATVKIYDALGRVVRTLSQGIVGSGDQTLDVNTKGIAPGDYTLELLAPELGISEHRHLVIVE